MKVCLYRVCIALSAVVAAPLFAQEGATPAGAAAANAQDAKADQSTVSQTDANAIVSYSIGYQMGEELQDFHRVDFDAIIAGVKDHIAGKKPAYTVEQTQAAFEKVMPEVQAQQQSRVEEASKKASETNDTWLAENAKKEGVKTTASGLQYKVLKEGTGESPTAADTVTVHYRGTLLDGTVFDSSYDRKDAQGKVKPEPATFPLRGVIKGWTEGLQLMKKGGKFEFYIPPALAYGAQGRPGIPPNAVLIFQVELLDIQKAEGSNPNEIVLDSQK